MAEVGAQRLDEIHVALTASRLDARCGATVDSFEHFEARIANTKLLANEREFCPRFQTFQIDIRAKAQRIDL